MTRKRESIFAILAICPWWISVAASVIAYIVLRDLLPHIHAGDKLTVPIVTGLGQLAYVSAPYVAFLLLLPLPFSLFNARQRKQTLESQTGLKSIRGLDWKTFEQLVGEAFRRQGFAVAETGQGGADGGLDLALRKGSELFLVQCKQWRAYKVSVNIVRELYGVMAAKGAAGGFVITSGKFTEDAKAFATGRNVELIDGPPPGENDCYCPNYGALLQASNCCNGRHTHMPKVQQPNGQAYSKAGRKCWRTVLGLFKIS